MGQPDEMRILWYRFQFGVAVLAGVWVLVSICCCCCCCNSCSCGSAAQPRSSYTADQLNDLALEIDRAGRGGHWPGQVKPVVAWPSCPPDKGVYISVLLLLLDAALDLFSILNMLATDNTWFAIVLTVIFSTSLTRG